jgi:serine/threonine-protein kinase
VIGDALARGTVVAGRYRIETRIGSGATGSVYRATQLALSRDIALKVLHARFAGDSRARARFEREARVATALEHESAVGIYDFGESDVEGLVFIAMELLAGKTLRRRQDGLGRLGLSEVLDIARQIADVLAAAHRMPLVHRDLKPENVFLEPLPEAPGASGSRGTRVRVVDFGLAFIAGSEREGRMTAHGVVTGTPEYVSPEQARGGEVGPPTDVYALGCMLFELLTGKVPFTGGEIEVLTQQMFAPPPRLTSAPHLAPIPTSLERLVLGMLKKRPEERPSAEEVRDVLSALDEDARERARNDTFLLGRASRMVSEAHPEPEAPRPSATGEGELLLAVIGPVDPELLVALAANGIVAFVVDGEPRDLEGAHVVYAPGATPERVAELTRGRALVLSDTPAADIDRIGALLAAGAAEVVPRPVTSDELVRRARRAARRRMREKTA